MNRYRLSALALLPAAALAMTACSSSTSGKGSNATSGASSASSPATAPTSTSTSSSAATSTSASTPAGSSADVQALAAKLQQGVSGIKTAHIALAINVAGQSINGSGDEKLSGGKLQAMNITESLPGGSGSFQIIVVDGKIYAKLPASVAKTSKPWVLVTSSSTNAVVKQLAGNIEPALNSASIGQVSEFASAASSATKVGTTTVNGVQAEHYSVVVDAAKLPADFPDRDALTQAGITTLPVELYLDKQGRPVEVTEKVTAQGQQVTTTITVSKYNQSLHITAPPASQVGTS